LTARTAGRTAAGNLWRKVSKYLAVARMGLATAIAYRGEYFLRSLTLVLILFVLATPKAITPRAAASPSAYA